MTVTISATCSSNSCGHWILWLLINLKHGMIQIVSVFIDCYNNNQSESLTICTSNKFKFLSKHVLKQIPLFVK